MGWFLWGVLLGWGACAIYVHVQRGGDAEKTDNGAAVVFAFLFLIALLISIGLGMEGGVIGPATPTPLGR